MAEQLPQNPAVGTRVVRFCLVQWGERGSRFELSDLRTAARQVRETYARCSQGRLQLQDACDAVRVPWDAVPENLKRAGQMCVRETERAQIYVIVHGLRNLNRAGGRVAYVSSCLVRNLCHELGHCLGLGHAGLEGDAYGDRTSFMGRYASAALTAPQYFWMGWMDDDDVGVGPGTYALRPVTDANADEGLRAVVIPRDDGRHVWVSLAKHGVTVHFGTRGGSTLVGHAGYTREGVSVERVDDTHVRVTVMGVTASELAPLEEVVSELECENDE